jgi:hypothetical protein
LVVWVSGCRPGIHITPFHEKERQELGKIGIAADSYVPKAVPKDGALARASNQITHVGDRIAATGKGAYEGGKKGFLIGATALACRGDSCVLNAALSLTGMTIGTVAGAINGAVEGPEHFTEAQRENYDALAEVQTAIEAIGLQGTLRDRLWKRLNEHSGNFVLVRELPDEHRGADSQYPFRRESEKYWPLRDQGISTILRVKIPFILFRGSHPSGPYTLTMPVETMFFRSTDRTCIRQTQWEYRGTTHLVDEWRANDAQLFSAELDKVLDLFVEELTSAYFSYPLTTADTDTRIIAISESDSCRG